MPTAAEFGNFATTNMIQEATAFKTVQRGEYRFQGNKIYEFDVEKGYARIGGKVSKDGQVKGSVFMKLQWKEERGANGKLKVACRLYAQALKALYPNNTVEELAAVDAKDLVDNMVKFPTTVFVGEYYAVPDNTNSYGSRRVTPKNADEIKDLLKQGATAKNEVISVSAAK